MDAYSPQELATTRTSRKELELELSKLQQKELWLLGLRYKEEWHKRYEDFEHSLVSIGESIALFVASLWHLSLLTVKRIRLWMAI